MAKKVKTPKGSSGRPKTDKLTLWVLWSEVTSGGERCEGQESDPWADHEPSYIDAHFKGAYIGKVPPTYGQHWSEKSESFTIPKTEFEAEPRTQVYAAIAHYSDGDTFGSSHGHVYVGGVYGSYDRAVEKTKEFEAISKGDYSVPWTGYFSSLESVSVETLQVLNGAPGRTMTASKASVSSTASKKL